LQMMYMVPLRRTILQFSQRGFTEALTFIGFASVSSVAYL
jgi:hypothetical protein